MKLTPRTYYVLGLVLFLAALYLAPTRGGVSWVCSALALLCFAAAASPRNCRCVRMWPQRPCGYCHPRKSI